VSGIHATQTRKRRKKHEKSDTTFTFVYVVEKKKDVIDAKKTPERRQNGKKKEK